MAKGLKEKVTEALRVFFQAAPGDDLALEDVPPGRIAGSLTSSKFRGKTHSQRQDLIWDALDQVLTPYERTKIVIILAHTPEEHKALGKSKKIA